MTGLEHAILGLATSARRPPPPPRVALAGAAPDGRREGRTGREGARDGDAWLAARELGLHREREALLGRLAALGPQVLDGPGRRDRSARELHRLVADLEHHRQRLNDLVYDSVSLELGGSE